MPNIIHKQLLDLERPETGPNDEAILTIRVPKRSQILCIQTQTTDFGGIEFGSKVFVWYSFPAGETDLVDAKIYAICTGQRYAGPPFKDAAGEYPESELNYLATTQHRSGSIILHWFLLPSLYVMKAI